MDFSQTPSARCLLRLSLQGRAGSQKYAHMLFVNQPPRVNRRFTDDELIAPGTMVDRRPPGHSCPAARCRPLERHTHRNSLHSPVPPAHSALAALSALYATTSTGQLHTNVTRADRPVEVQMLSVPCDPAALERIARAGIRRANHWLPSGPRSTVERALDRWAGAISEFTGG
jgi:hypothetical protein